VVSVRQGFAWIHGPSEPIPSDPAFRSVFDKAIHATVAVDDRRAPPGAPVSVSNRVASRVGDATRHATTNATARQRAHLAGLGGPAVGRPYRGRYVGAVADGCARVRGRP